MSQFNRTALQDIDTGGGVPRGPRPPAVDAAGRRSLDDQVDYLLASIEPLAPFGMSLADAWGLSLCEDIIAETNLPSVPVVEVDGYAFAIEDLATVPGARTTLVVAQGESAFNAVGIGEAVPVKAGQPLPRAADTVVANWQVTPGEEAGRAVIKLRTKVAAGDWVRPAGTEASAGELLAKAGTPLNDRRSALLAAAGFTRVLARPRTRIAVVQVTDANNPNPPDGGRTPGAGVHLINGAARADGATVFRVHVDLTDLPRAHDHLNDELIRADLVLTVGGMTEAGADPRLITLLHGMGEVEETLVAMRPGQRHGFGKIADDKTPVLMLPSDPPALLAAYHAFARPVLRKMMGAEPISHEPMLCFAERDMEVEPGVTELVPCRLVEHRNRYMASEITSRRHAILPTLVNADALVILPGDKGRVFAGEALAAWLLGDPRSVTE